MTRDRDQGARAVIIALFYGVAGPPLGALAMTVGLVLWGLANGRPPIHGFFGSLGVALFFAILSYGFSVSYALLTGIIVAGWYFFLGRTPLLVAAIAPAATIVPGLALAPMESARRMPLDDWGIVPLIAVGVASSLLCWTIVRMRGWELEA